ncbi:hypothetical protein UlMin_040224 [Ulmus minor]
MGFPEKQQVEVALDSDNKKWVIAGIPLRAPLKPVYTKNQREGGEEEECSTTPTGEEARIPTRLTCPPAPRKKKASSKCNCSGVKEFFTPPDLESVFLVRHVERAK